MNGSIFQNFPKFEPKKSFEKSGNFVQNLAKIGPIGILNGSLFLAKFEFVCVCCQIPLRHIQWRNRRGNFCWRIGKKEARKKGWKLRRKGGKLEMEAGKRQKKRWGPFFFFFFFCFSLLKTTKICFGSTKMEIFYREKAFHAGKKIRKNDFAPSEKYACYAPGHIPTKTKLECPLGLQISFELIEETYVVPVLFFTTNPS